MNNLPKEIANLLEIYKANGFSAYVVGGACRDFLMGISPKDYDLAVSALPEETAQLMKGKKVIPTGLRHGTQTVITGDYFVEITTFRTEKGYSDSRRPDEVIFVSDIETDLARRDFTINAIAFDGKDFIDPFGGAQDIKAGIIRAVGSPEERFSEDALRIMRALRFAATLGFSLSEETEAAAFRCAEKLKKIAAERITAELFLLLCGENAGDVIIKYVDILGVFLPELLKIKGLAANNPVHSFDVLTHTAKSVDAAPKDKIIRLAMLYHDVGKAYCYTEDEAGIGHFYGHPKISEQLAIKRFDELKIDNKTKEESIYLIANHMFDFHFFIQDGDKFVRRALHKHGEERLWNLFAVVRADIAALRDDVAKELAVEKEAENLLRALLESENCFKLSDLAVNGNDLINSGIPEGKLIGQKLDMLFKKVVIDGIPNDKEILLKECLRDE